MLIICGLLKGLSFPAIRIGLGEQSISRIEQKVGQISPGLSRSSGGLGLDDDSSTALCNHVHFLLRLGFRRWLTLRPRTGLINSTSLLVRSKYMLS